MCRTIADHLLGTRTLAAGISVGRRPLTVFIATVRDGVTVQMTPLEAEYLAEQLVRLAAECRERIGKMASE